jgi:microcystin degradation protein MlrC
MNGSDKMIQVVVFSAEYKNCLLNGAILVEGVKTSLLLYLVDSLEAMAPPRVIIGMMMHETNTFSAVATTLEDFEPLYGEEFVKANRGTRSGVGGFLDVLEKHRVEIIPSMGAGATPAGSLAKKDFKHIVDTIVGVAKDTGHVDGVLLALHGAMIVEGEPDAEAALLKKLKKTLGKETPIIITLDLHGLISKPMVENCDAIFGYDTNPHIDMYERGVEAAETLMKTIKGELHPVVAFKKLPMLPPTINQRTTEGPMVKLLEKARRYEKQKGVINVCIFPAFAYTDVERVGSAVVAVTDGDRELAQGICDELGAEMYAHREEFLKKLTPIKEAVERAIKAPEGPIILADVADNPGGGSPGDGTEILRELVRQGSKNVGVACIKDPEAVAKAIEAGVLGKFDMQIGGKTDEHHGKPLRVKGVVRTITDGRFVCKAGAVGVVENVGRTAVIDANGVEIILTERSHAPNDPEVYRRNGIEPRDKKILVLKSRGHFRAAYESFSKEVIEVDGPGLTTPNLSRFTFKRIPRPMWPFDKV